MNVRDELLENYRGFLDELAEAGIDFDASEYHAGMEAGLAVQARAAGVTDRTLWEARDRYYGQLETGGSDE